MPELSRGLEAVFKFLRDHSEGDAVSEADILDATGWKRSSFLTYLRKNKLAPFLARRPDGQFLILRGGPNLTEKDIAGALTQVTPDPMRLYKGEPLTGRSGVYTLDAEVGRGAVGHVWSATAGATGGAVAVKVVNPRPDLLEPTAFSNVSRRFRHEAENGVQLSHDCLIRYLDYGTLRTRAFLVMELASASVRDTLDRDGLMPLDAACGIVLRSLAALEYLHGRGDVHRDVKPANMLMVKRGVVLGDLGIVRWDDLSSAFTSAGTLTLASVQLGSWYYMAPEQQESPHDATPASDLYGLGVTWYELLTGRTPAPAVFAAGKAPPPCSERDVADVIVALTRFEPGERPTIAEVRGAALQHA